MPKATVLPLARGHKESDAMSLGEMDAARAANLRERATAMETVSGDAEATALMRTFTNPSWHDLHVEELTQIDLLAETAARVIFGAGSRDRLDKAVSADLEQGAAYLARRIHPEFVKAAHEQAVETLLGSDTFASLLSGRPRSAAERRILAHWLVTEMRASFHAVMEARIPLTPAVYLRCTAGATERGAR